MSKHRNLIISLLLISVLTITLLPGCIGSADSTADPARKYDIVKVEEIESQGLKWKIYQLRIDLEAGGVFTVDLNLGDGDKVDCWYKIEKPKTGGSLDFQVKAGNAVIYETPASTTDDGVVSDRMTFDASRANGTSYRLIFRNTMTEENVKETIYTEIEYPVRASGEDSIFVPLETD